MKLRSSGISTAFLSLLALCAAPQVLRGQPAELLRRPEHFERSRDYDALHYRLIFVFADKDKSYQGENSITLISLRDKLESCLLDAENLTVTSVSDTTGRPLPFSQKDKTLAITLPESLGYGEKATFTVRFSQKNPKTGMKFIDAASDHPGQINTYSWPEDAHRWFPCFDDPNDKITDEVFATVRSDWNVLSNGRLVDVTEDKSAGTKTWHWAQESPHPAYCIMLAAGPFKIIHDMLGPLPVNYWVYPKDGADAPRSFRKTPKMIDFYGRTFGFAYPWAKYDQVCVAGYGGGMEATTATILGQDTIHDERAEQDFPSDGLVAHELAHMWWGDLITERAWSDVWLSESFATYAEYLWTRFDRGEDEGALNLEEKKSSYLEEARNRYIRPIVFNHYNQPWDIMDGHSYPKGAAVLHMLRFLMGDGPFFRTLGEFLKRFAYKNADTHDFMTVVKDVNGQNLDWFFEQWVTRPGHPVFEVSSEWDEPSAKLRVRVRQVQDFSRNIPVFRTPVILGIRTDNGSTSERVWINTKDEVFEFDAPRKPRLVRFDEGNNLLKEVTFPKSREELLFELESDDAVGRIGAVRELAKVPDQAAVREPLLRAAQEDCFWAVRKDALEVLASLKAPGLAVFFKGRTHDPNSKVRAAAVRALGQLKSPDLVAFFEDAFAKDSSYVVQSEALAAMGACGGRAQISFLKKASSMPSPRNIIRRNAESAIKKIEESHPVKGSDDFEEEP